MKVYISGPMRGKPAYNFPAFDQAAARIRNVGWEPVNPADLDRASGDCEDMESPSFIRRAMRRDIDALFACDAVALLPGWRHSAGAVAEVAVSCVLRMRVLDAVSLHDTTEEIREWWQSTLGAGEPCLSRLTTSWRPKSS